MTRAERRETRLTFALVFMDVVILLEAAIMTAQTVDYRATHRATAGPTVTLEAIRP